MPPGLARDKCRPPVGATDVDPRQYTDGIAIAFDGEAGNLVTHIKVIDTNPEFPFSEALSSDGLTLNIWFRDGYVMPYDTKFDIMFVGRSGCMPMHGISSDCQPIPVVYSFTTMPKSKKR